MIGRYTTGACTRFLRLSECKTAQCRAKGQLSARYDFEDFEFLPVLDGVRDGDRRLATHNNDRVRLDAVGPQDVLHSGLWLGDGDLPLAAVEAATHSDFGTNPSTRRGAWRSQESPLL